MAKYFINFGANGESNGELPVGWSLGWGSPSGVWKMAAEPSASNGRVLDVKAGTSGSPVLYSLFYDALPNEDDVEVLVRFFPTDDPSSRYKDLGILARASAPAKNGYACSGTTRINNTSIYRYTSGARDPLSGVVSPDVQSDRWQYLRFLLSGTGLKFQLWYDGDPPPTGWTADTFDASYASGMVGLLHRYGRVKYDWISFGTNGDAAPSAPVALPEFNGPIPDQAGSAGSATSLNASVYFTGAVRYIASGLPDGLMIDFATGVVSGTPTTVQTVSPTITATNESGSVNANAFSWQIVEGPVTFLSDTFTDANGTLLENHSPETGGTWKVYESTGSITIEGNELGPADSANSYTDYYNTVVPPSTNFSVEADVRAGSATYDGASFMGLMARMPPEQTPEDAAWAYLFVDGGGQFVIDYRGGQAPVPQPAAGEVTKLRLEVIGGYSRAFWGGELVGQAHADTQPPAGEVGVTHTHFAGAAWTMDNLRAETVVLPVPIDAPVIESVDARDRLVTVVIAHYVPNAIEYEYRVDGGAPQNAGPAYVPPGTPRPLSDFSAGQTYQLEYRAINPWGAGPWSDPFEFTTLFIYDPFTANNGTLLENYTNSSTGGAWVKLTNVSDSAVIDEFEVARPQSAGFPIYYENTAAPPSTDYSVSATVTIISTAGPTQVAGIAARMQGADLSGYRLLVDNDNDNLALRLEKRQTVPFVIDSVVIGARSDLVGAKLGLRLEVRGANIDCFLDGVPIISVVDTEIATAGRAGIVVGLDDRKLDEFRVQQLFADQPATVSAALVADGSATLVTTLDLSGNPSLSGALVAGGAASLSVILGLDDPPVLAAALVADGSTSLGVSLSLEAAPELSGALVADGAASLSGSLGLAAHPVVAGMLAADGVVSLSAALVLDPKPTVSAALVGDGAASLSFGVTLAAHPAVAGALVAGSAPSLSVSLRVRGSTDPSLVAVMLDTPVMWAPVRETEAAWSPVSEHEV